MTSASTAGSTTSPASTDIADEIFVCGTAAEVSSVNSVDDRSIPAQAQDHGDRRDLRPSRPAGRTPVQRMVRLAEVSWTAGAEPSHGGGFGGQRPWAGAPRPVIDPVSPVDHQQFSAGRTAGSTNSPSTPPGQREEPPRKGRRPEPLRCPGQLKVGLRVIHRGPTCWG